MLISSKVFEDDIEEEMTRPTEKVVNMSVAPGKIIDVEEASFC